MSENDIKPVAVLCETAAGRYWSTNVAVHCLPLGDYYDQSAIDHLTAEAERSETAFDLLKEAYSLAEAKIARLAAERDAAVADAARYRALIEYALAQHNGHHSDQHNHWAAKAMSELAAIDAARAKVGQG